jgi:hypothetical protein
MIFETEGVKLFQPLDPYMGPRYIEAVDNNMESEVLDQL